MSDEIDVVRDDDGMAVFGDSTAVERFLQASGLQSREIGLPRLGQVMSGASGAARAAGDISAASGRWVKLTKDSAKALDQFTAMKGSTAGVSRAIVTENGKIKNILEFTRLSSTLTSPAMLTGVAGIMAQVAMQQAMDEITDYLAKIDAKLDDVLRAQKDAALADLIGIELVITDALKVRDRVGHVGEVTWSKVQHSEYTIARAQSYALLQLDALAEKLEKTNKVGDLAHVAKDAERTIRDWLAVLARCFQLQEGIAILELDRVMQTAPAELDKHREALQLARTDRRATISGRTAQLLGRIDEAAKIGDLKVVLHPLDAGAVIRSTNAVAADVVEFNDRLGIEGSRAALESKRWHMAMSDVAEDTRDKLAETGSDGLRVAGRLSGDALDKAGEAAEAVSARLSGWADRLRRTSKDGERSETD